MPIYFMQDDAGDFASVLFTVLQDRSYQSAKLSLQTINAKLDDIVRSVNPSQFRSSVNFVLRHIHMRKVGNF